MQVTSVTYARLYNLGNYENERLEAQVAVEPGDEPLLAFELARATVEQQHALLTEERDEARRREREAYEARERAQRAAWEAEREARLAATKQTPDDEEPEF